MAVNFLASDEQTEQWTMRHWMAQCGGRTCKQCGVYVDADYLDRHLEWHEKLRRAVDEAETLG